MDSRELERCEKAIREYGLTSPVVVRSVDGAYQVLSGECERMVLARMRQSMTPAVVVEQIDDPAVGRNTICVTRGLLTLTGHSLDAGDIAGVLAHEAGHLHFGDSGRLAIALTANRLGVVSYRILDFSSSVCEAFGRGVLQSGRMLGGSGGIAGIFITLTAMLVVVVANVFNLAMKVFSFTFQVAANVSLRAVGRTEEFRADLFARNIGFGPQLVKFLRQIEALDATPRDIWAVLYRTHPPTAARIDRLLQGVN